MATPAKRARRAPARPAAAAPAAPPAVPPILGTIGVGLHVAAAPIAPAAPAAAPAVALAPAVLPAHPAPAMAPRAATTNWWPAALAVAVVAVVFGWIFHPTTPAPPALVPSAIVTPVIAAPAPVIAAPTPVVVPSPVAKVQVVTGQPAARASGPGPSGRYGVYEQHQGMPPVLTKTPCFANGRNGFRGQDESGAWGCVHM